MIIFDTSNLCLRSAVIEDSLCGRNVFDQGDLCTGDAADLADIRIGDPIDQDNLCALNSTTVDLDDLCTQLGNDVEAAVYRADTTIITVDNTSLGADYAL